MDSQLDFWREQVGTTPVLDLPLDHPRTPRQSYEYDLVSFLIPADLERRLQHLAVGQGVAKPGVYLAAYAILLSRYGNAQRVLIGLPRSERDPQAAVGEFLGCGVVRIDCVPEHSFPTLLREVSGQAAEATRHPRVSLSLLAQHLNVASVPGRAPLSDVRFLWDCESMLSGVSPLDEACDLAMTAGTSNDGVAGSLIYRMDLFKRSTIERMTRHFTQLLESIASDADAPIGDLSMLPDDERALILGGYGGGSAEYPWRTLHELFAEQVELRPEAEALVFGAERLTYRDVDRRSNQIANFLREHGIQHGDRIGIFMDRSANMVISMVGILKAGGTYMPIDPDYPAERLKFIAEDTEVRFVFTETTVQAKLPAAAPLVYLDDSSCPVASCSSDPVRNVSTPESVAVAIYTSGSTGKPKAACIPHRAAVRLVRNTNFVQATAEDRISQVSSPSFDAAILEIWAALTNGAALIGIRKETLLDPAELTKLLRAERLTILFVNTAYVHQIGRDAPEVLKGPRKIMFGGEAAEPGPMRNILRHVPPGTLVNLYGPAEGCVVTSYYEINSVADDQTTIPIGRPITNTRMYLLDQRMHLVPIGIRGELYVGGDGVARGYWNRPELTAQRFIPDPFSDKLGGLLYRTGDLGRLRENGEFEFHGRIDDQIKINGHRIELAEVREAITSHSAVKQVHLAVREDQPGDRRLVAYVVLRQALESAAELLRDHVKETLPSHMRPSAFVVLDSIPLNTNGKVDRKALPPPSTGTGDAAGFVPPRTDLERTLAGIWKELLGVERIGIHDNFFDSGGHSLLAARLIAGIEKKTGQNIPVATLFEAPTIAGLAQKLRDHSYASAWAPLVELHAPACPAKAPPFFCIHSLGANLVSFHKLATLLRPDRAVYGLQPHGLDGKQKPLDTVSAMAEAYLEEIRKKQSRGPYYVGGICLGGVVAYEVARLLEAENEEVRLLALIDSFLPGEQHCVHTRSSRAEYLDRHLGEMLLLPGTERLKYIARWIGNGFIRLGWALGFRPHDSIARATRRVVEANEKAVFGYSPEHYAGKITQLMCSDWAERAYEDRRLAWCSVAAAGLEIHIVPGDHLTMVEEPHVRALAAELQACLDRADGLTVPHAAAGFEPSPELLASRATATTPAKKHSPAPFSSANPLSVSR